MTHDTPMKDNLVRVDEYLANEPMEHEMTHPQVKPQEKEGK